MKTLDREKINAYVEQIFKDMAGAMTAGLGYVGVQTGLFRSMQGQGTMRMQQVVEASGLQPRYVEEWLKGMVCAGYLDYDPEQATYELPDELAFLLASDDTDHFAGGMFSMAPALLKVAPQVAEAFRQGGGVRFDQFGPECVAALDLLNRGNYDHKLVKYWLQALPDVVKKLEGGAAVLDVGCGTGRVVCVLAKAFPHSSFTGIDLDPNSIEQANQAAEENNLTSRVRFISQSVEQLPEEESFNLITACDCVHDLADPVSTLTSIQRRLKSDGTFFVVEPKAADRLEDNRHSVGAMFYGYSVFHCMTQSLANGGPGLGTCMGPQQTEALMRDAGFTEFAILDIKSRVNLFYAAR